MVKQKKAFMPANAKLAVGGANTLLIKGGKYNKDRQTLTVKYNAYFARDERMTEEHAASSLMSTINVQGHLVVHDDFVTAMDRLRLHFIFITGAWLEKDHDSKLFKDWRNGNMNKHLMEMAEDYQINGYAISGEGDDTKVLIMGQKNVKAGVMAINTPLILVGNSEIYQFAEILKRDVNLLIQETENYVNGKCAWNGQLDLFEAPKIGVDVVDEMEPEETNIFMPKRPAMAVGEN